MYIFIPMLYTGTYTTRTQANKYKIRRILYTMLSVLVYYYLNNFLVSSSSSSWNYSVEILNAKQYCKTKYVASFSLSRAMDEVELAAKYAENNNEM